MEPAPGIPNKMDYAHEQAAMKQYLGQRIEGMLKAVSAPILRQDHTYEMRTARGELAGAPPTVRFRDQELGRDISDRLKSTYTSSSTQSTASYSGLVGKTTSTGYASTHGTTSYSVSGSSFSTSYGHSGESSYGGENPSSSYMSGLPNYQ